MQGLIKCARCHSEMIEHFYDVNRKGIRNKCCISCLSRFKCSLCPYKSNRQYDIEKHIKRMHLKIKNHKCTTCDYTCASISDLNRHIKQVHNKIKNHKCTKCEYACSLKSCLTDHIIAVHDKIKDSQCLTCPYKCSRSSDLTKHIKTCTGKLNCSSGELAVMNALKSLNITYLYDTSYGNVKHKSLLKWDFVIETGDEPLFIEYDGECHFLQSAMVGYHKREQKKI